MELKLVVDSPKYSDTDIIRALAIEQNISYITLKNLREQRNFCTLHSNRLSQKLSQGCYMSRQLQSYSQLHTKEAMEFHLEDVSNIYKDILHTLSKFLCTYPKGR